MKRAVPEHRFLDADESPTSLSLPACDVRFLIGQTRSSYRYVQKQREKYRKEHGHGFVPAEGKHDAKLIALTKLERVERTLCEAVGEVSMFVSCKVRLVCPNPRCRQTSHFPQEARGKLVRCPCCHTMFRVPEKSG